MGTLLNLEREEENDSIESELLKIGKYIHIITCRK